MSAVRRVVIADPGLKSEQGHYLSYAESLATAWRARGVEVVLFGHRQAAATPLADRVWPVFSRHLRQGQQDPQVDGLHRLAAAVRAAVRRPAAYLYFSRLQFGGGAPGAGRLHRLLARALGAPMRLCVAIDRAWLPQHDRRTWAARRAKAARAAAARSAADLRAGLSRLSRPLDEADLVLLPTCGETEALAVARLLRQWPPARKPAWRLVFRRPLTVRRPGSRWEQLAPVLRSSPTAQALEQLARAPGRVTCFTDTRQLSRQYQAVARPALASLPVPHTRMAAAPPEPGPETVVSYLGDARLEKGVALVPGIVEAVRKARLERPVRFRIQCHFNVPGGEAGAREAVAALRDMAGPDLELIDRPLTRTEYEAALASTDLMLCPYDRDLYRERSSGILCEALALGIPVLVPSGSWLESEFALESDAWIRAGEAGATRLSLVGAEPGALTLSDNGDVSFAPESWATLDLSLPPSERARMITVAFGVQACAAESVFETAAEMRTAEGGVVARRLYRVHVGEGGAYARTGPRARPLFRLRAPAEAAQLRLAFRNAYSGERLLLRTLAVHIAEAGAEAAPGAIGHAFGADEEAAPAVLEMLTHLDQYRRTAQAFAPPYAAFHNAVEVARRLEA